MNSALNLDVDISFTSHRMMPAGISVYDNWKKLHFTIFE